MSKVPLMRPRPKHSKRRTLEGKMVLIWILLDLYTTKCFVFSFGGVLGTSNELNSRGGVSLIGFVNLEAAEKRPGVIDLSGCYFCWRMFWDH